LLDYATKSNRNRVEKLIDGHDLMRIFRMARGPDIGVVLERLEEAQAMGLIRNRKEALIKAEAILKTIRG
jgi:tRNA nucleotidyltransferase/poly(A) polymerase